MDEVRRLIAEIPIDELRENVRTCVEHTCAAFLGCYPEGRLARGGTLDGFDTKQAEYIKTKISMEESDILTAGDIEYGAMFDVFANKMANTSKFWNTFTHPLHFVKKGDSFVSVLFGIIQAVELSPVPTELPHLFEALVTGEWKAFIMNFVGLISPSGIKLEVLGNFAMFSISEETSLLNLLEWCKRELSTGEGPVDHLIQSLRQQDREAT